jgi:hypothetical protein
VKPQRLAANDIIEFSVLTPEGRELWKWVARGTPSRPQAESGQAARIERSGHTVSAGAFALEFDAANGELVRLADGVLQVELRGPRITAWLRRPGTRGFDDLAAAANLLTLELAPSDAHDVLARATYDGPLRAATWKIRGGELVLQYELAFEGRADIFGIRFDPAGERVTAKRWVGAGPYRIWNNRQAGTKFGLHATNYSLSVPGETFQYPEFEGFFGEWNWLQLHTRGAQIVIRNASGVPFFGLYAPAPGEKPILELPDMGWSFLHAIPSIGTKFAPAEVLGPQSQSKQLSGAIHGELTFSLAPPGK